MASPYLRTTNLLGVGSPEVLCWDPNFRPELGHNIGERVVKFLKASKLTIKLPLIIISMVFVAIVATSLIAHRSASGKIIEGAERRIATIATMRAAAIEEYFEAIRRDLDVIASNPRTAQAVATFSRHFGGYADPLQDLQRNYITNNPNPPGELDLMISAGTGDPYDAAHVRHHPFFDHLQNVQGYYDVFLFDTEGNLVYSVFKELDFATNMLSGEWRDTGLGEVFRLGLEVAQDGSPAFVDFAPYAPSAGAPASFIARSIFDASGERVGVLAYQMPIDAINAVAGSEAGLGTSGDAFLVGSDGYLRTDSRRTQASDMLETSADSAIVESAFSGVRAIGFGSDFSGVENLIVAVPIDILGVRWVLAAAESTTEIMAPLRSMELAFLIAVVLLCLAALVISVLISRSITKPLARVRDAMTQISQRAFDTDVPSLERADEIGDISRTLETFRTSLRDAQSKEQRVEADRQVREASQRLVVNSLQAALGQLSNGNLAVKIDEVFETEYECIRHDFNSAAEALNAAMSVIVLNALTIQGSALEITSAADDLSERTESQAATLEQTAAALEELTSSVISAADGAREVAVIVSDAQSGAEKSESVVEEAIAAMGEIETSSLEISKIIKVIEDIAFQTNLLALNAGVEAARAGDAGRGFAVVASEVRALAQRSSEAAKEIKILISSSGEQVMRGGKRVNEAGAALGVILDSVRTIAEHVQTMAVTTAEQSTGLNEISTAMNHLDEATQRNAAMVEETTAASHVLRQEADALKSTTSRFHLVDQAASTSLEGDNIIMRVA